MVTLASILLLTDILLAKFKVPLQFLIIRLGYVAEFQYTRKLKLKS